jgi:hypothetical protein
VLDGARLTAELGDLPATPLVEALADTLRGRGVLPAATEALAA